MTQGTKHALILMGCLLLMGGTAGFAIGMADVEAGKLNREHDRFIFLEGRDSQVLSELATSCKDWAKEDKTMNAKVCDTFQKVSDEKREKYDPTALTVDTTPTASKVRH